MKRLQKPPLREAKTSKKEPLAEGLQTVVPTDPLGRRMWRKMSDEEIVEYVRKVMEETEISGRSELSIVDSGAYAVLKIRRLLEKVGFVEQQRKKRSWKELSDEEVVEIAREFMDTIDITGRSELEKADRGLYSVLKRRELLDSVGFEEKRKKVRLWSEMSDEEVVELARKIIEEKGISGRTELNRSETSLYRVLKKRGLLSKVGFEDKWKKARAWRDMSDEEIIGFARRVMEEKGISGRKELENADRGLYIVLWKRKLLAKIGFEIQLKKRRAWRDLNDEEIVEFAQKFMEEKGISGRGELSLTISGLYRALKKRRLLDEVGFEEKRRKRRSWRDVTDDEVVEIAKRVMEQEGISRRSELEKIDSGLYLILMKRNLCDKVGFENKERSWKELSDEEVVEIARRVVKENNIIKRDELKKTDSGLYEVLRKRGLLDSAFAKLDQQISDSARDAVIDALEAFSVENDNGSLEDDAA